MLTVDHVKLRRKNRVVEVVPLCGLDDARALELASAAVDIALAHEGAARSTLEEALDELPVSPKEARFGRALKKLVLDACAFDVDTTLDPEALRSDVFHAASRARTTASFDRARVIAEVAKARDVDTDEVERALFADLNAAHAVRGLDVDTADALLERARVNEIQAVLLRATRVVVDVEASPLELRALLRALKLHQLLFELDAVDENSVRLSIEGPMALFQQSTRYGLKLALLVPHLIACKRAAVDATVRLQKGGADERFVWKTERDAHASNENAPASLGDVAHELLEELRASTDMAFVATEANEILRAAEGGAVVVPDLRLEHKKTGDVVYVEVLGFWSRAAVWKRVDLVGAGFPYRVVFCASDRLRVSEQALPDEAPSALVVFKGVLRASRVLAAADALVAKK